MEAINKNNIPVGMIKTFFTTGRDRNGKKFRIESSSLNYINCINAYSDKIVWVVLENDKRIKLY